jgi:tRNA threonylcarbamoyladenosine biosynthesis protein TsaB
MTTPLKFLAFDTSTDSMSIAVTDGVRVWQHTGPGGAQSSTTLIPAILALMAEAGLTLRALDAIAFGRGPGSFTGLRTACSVAQGLALGAGVQVLPVDTLMALAEEARVQLAAPAAPEMSNVPGAPFHVTAMLDARMDEMYVQPFAWSGGVWRPLAACGLVRPENFAPDAATCLLAGNVFAVYGDRLPADALRLPTRQALPTAVAMLRLAPGLVAAGHRVPADQALPLYVRDKVAQTTEERAKIKADAALAAGAAQTVPNPP